MKLFFMIFLLIVQNEVFAQNTQVPGLQIKLSNTLAKVSKEPQVRCRDEILGITPQTFVNAPSFSFEPFEFQWLASETSFEFRSVQVAFKDSSSQKPYICNIEGEELMAVFGGKIKIGAGDTKRYRSQCTIRCGDVPKTLFQKPNQVVNGFFRIVGFESDGVDLFLSSQIEIPVSLQN